MTDIDEDSGRTSERGLTDRMAFRGIDWHTVPAQPGVYVIYDHEEVVDVGMAGRNGRGSLRSRLRDHASGQIVNMFAQYLFVTRVQLLAAERIVHPRDAKAACRSYISERCLFRFRTTAGSPEARELERQLKAALRPSLHP